MKDTNSPNGKGTEASHPASVNISELLARVDNDRELLRDLLSIFKEEFPPQFEDLRAAIARQDLPRVAALSHTLKGMFANLAVAKAAGRASALEQTVQQADKAALSPAFASLEESVQGLLAEIEFYIEGTPH